MMRFSKPAGAGLLLASMLALLPATLSVLAAAPAAAATFSVSPIRVELDARHHTSVLTFSNGGHEALRMQVRTMRWSMAPDGAWQLAPSDDLIATPELLEIAPGQALQLRVGSMAEAGASEASYRLLIDELPNLAAGDGHGAEVKVLTQVSLPVYLEPQQARRQPVLRSAAIQDGALTIGIGDEGTQRLDSQGVKLSLEDGAGRQVGLHDEVVNYVLAGSTFYLRMKLPPRECAQAAKVTLSWPSMAGLSLTHPISRGGDSCRGGGSH